MTSGTKAYGRRIAVATPSGTRFVEQWYGTKTWSGGDRPKVATPSAPSYFYSNGTPKRFRLPVTFPGGKKGYVWYRNPFPPRSKRPEFPPDTPHGWTMSRTTRSCDIGLTQGYSASGSLTTSSWAGVDEQAALFPANYLGGNTLSAVRLKAIDHLREKIVGSDFDLGVFLGTGHQSFQMIAETAVTIRKALSQTRRGRLAKAAAELKKLNTIRGRVLPVSQLKDARAEMRRASRAISRARASGNPVEIDVSISNGWLQLQYGWLPLLSDVKSAAEALAERNGNAGDYRKVYRARARARFGPIVNQPMAEIVGGGYREESVQVIAYIKSISGATLHGITNPLSLAWELLPWSFVVDWFIPVGDYLSRLNFVNALDATYVITSRTLQLRTGSDGSYRTTGSAFPTARYVFQGMNYSYESVVFSREVTTTLTIPKPQIVPLTQAVSFRRALNGIALLVQRFK